jgi:hypothetical protein
MKRILVIYILASLACTTSFTQSVGIGTTTPNSSAQLDIQSNSRGMLIPRMTSAQRAAIAAPATGLLVFDNTTGSFWFKSAGNWIELVDTLNNVWKKNGTNAYVGTSGNVGIGTPTPSYDVHLNRPSPSIGFTDAGKGHFSGTIVGDSADLVINAYRRSLGINPSGNVILQVNAALATSGKVGIGTYEPDTKLHIDNGSNANASSGGYLQIGASNSANIAFDNNEIQARSNGAAGKLFMQANGGDLQLGGTNHILFNEGYQLYRKRPLSSYADLLPIAYAKVNSGGTALSGTGNLSVSQVGEGEYRLVLLGEANLYANRNQYTILLTVNGSVVISPKYGAADILDDNAIWVRIATPRLNYVNVNMCGCPQTLASYLSSNVYADATDSDFSIVIYKM